MTELWKTVDGFQGEYEVSDGGRVRSLDRTIVRVVRGRSQPTRLKGKILKHSKDSSGYLQVLLSRDSKDFMRLVHRLVAVAFINNPDSKPCVNHKDGDPTNNAASNLEWVTNQENQLHAIQVLRRMRGRSKLTPEVVAEIRRRFDAGERQSDLAAAYGVTRTLMFRIVRRETWRHVA